jgi:hypothetical protein
LAADQDGAVLITRLHGDWYRADALHTPAVLTSERPQMRATLRALMSTRLIVVLGATRDRMTSSRARSAT